MSNAESKGPLSSSPPDHGAIKLGGRVGRVVFERGIFIAEVTIVQPHPGANGTELATMKLRIPRDLGLELLGHDGPEPRVSIAVAVYRG